MEVYLSALELGYFEASFAFDGLPDEHVWKRPAAAAQGLLSVGELAGHVAYWEAVRLAGEADEKGHPDLTTCRVSSLLIDHRFSYYATAIATPPSEAQLTMTAAQVCSEFVRIHQAAVADLRSRNPRLEDTAAGWPAGYTNLGFL